MRIKRKHNPSVIKIEQCDGTLQAVDPNNWYDYLRDPYHLLLTIPWA